MWWGRPASPPTCTATDQYRQDWPVRIGPSGRVRQGTGRDQGADRAQGHRQGGEGEPLALPDLAQGAGGPADRGRVVLGPGGQPLLGGTHATDRQDVAGQGGVRGVQVVAQGGPGHTAPPVLA